MKKFLSFLFALFMGLNAMAANNVINGDFSDGTNGWTISMKNADTAVYQITTSEDGLQIYQKVKAGDRLDITQDIAVEKNAQYILSFDYKATHKKFRIWSFLVSDNDVWVYFTDNAQTDSLRTYNDYFAVTDEWRNISYPISVPDVDSIHIFRLQFRCYKQAGCTVNLNNVSLVKVGDEEVPTKLEFVEYNKNYKFIKNGKMYIKRGEYTYDIFGNIVK